MWWQNLWGQRAEPTTDLKVMAILLKANGELSGYKIGEQSQVGGGLLYPALIRLEDRRWITSRWQDWESADPRMASRPRPRYYRATRLGAETALPLVTRAGLYP